MQRTAHNTYFEDVLRKMNFNNFSRTYQGIFEGDAIIFPPEFIIAELSERIAVYKYIQTYFADVLREKK